MHKIQQDLLRLIASSELGGLPFRDIGKLLDPADPLHPQKVKHHLLQLENKGLIEIDRDREVIRKVPKHSATARRARLFSIPIFGAADCGPATMLADDRVQGFLKVSRNLLKPKTSLFALRASGDSMNMADINGNTIEHGDYVVIDSERRDPDDKQYIVSVIDDFANIKRFVRDRQNQRIFLLSESTHDFPPIIIHPKDVPYVICGTVVQVIKKPKI